MVSVENHHGEIASFCDCDGDGKRDEACQIWLKDMPSGEQVLLPTTGLWRRRTMRQRTKEFPSGEIQQSCECDFVLRWYRRRK